MWQKATGCLSAEPLPGWQWTRGVLLTLLLVLPMAQAFAAADPEVLRVSVARSLKDLGLADALVEEFRKTHPDVTVKLLSGGVLDVLDDGRQGLTDVVITHHAFHERKFVEEGYGMLRTQILNTEYAVFGPPGDTLGLSKESDIVAVLKLLAENEVDFFVPSPRSGTYMKIEELWSVAGINPTWLGYENTGGSGYGTLLQAAELGAYTIAEMGTYVLNHEAVRRQSRQGAGCKCRACRTLS
jgi:tungstate transport system substrate-binding protein